MKLFTLIIFLAVSNITSSNSKLVHHPEFISSEIVWHTKGHRIDKVPTNIGQNKIKIQWEEHSIPLIYSATIEAYKKSLEILIERPNGSEVFVMFIDNVIWEISICHEHDDNLIECGKEW